MQNLDFLWRPIGLDDFQSFYALMKETFPPTEIRSEADQKRLLQNPLYRIDAAFAKDGSPLLYLCQWQLGNFIFWEHLLVHPARRGEGLGSAFLRHLLSQADPNKTLVLEVEPPEFGKDACRRIAFYERHGLTLNRWHYVQPVMQAGQKELPLRLMSWPQELSARQFQSFRERSRREVYSRSDSLTPQSEQPS